MERSYQWEIIESKYFTDDEKKKIYEMYYDSYKKIGIIFKDVELMLSYYPCTYMFLTSSKKDANSIKGCIIYWLSDHGNKIGLVFSETVEIGKEYVIPKVASLLKTNGWICELSDALEHMIRKYYGINNITDIRVIQQIANIQDESQIVKSKNDPRIKNDPQGKTFVGQYWRQIAGEVHKKGLYGIPCLQFNNQTCQRECLIPMSFEKHLTDEQ